MRIVLKDRIIEIKHVKLKRNTLFAYTPEFAFIIPMESEEIASKKMLSLGASGFVDCTKYSYETVMERFL